MTTDFKPFILSSLETMRLGETAKGETFKALSYKKVIDSLKGYEGPIYSAEAVKDLKGVGKKIYEKIEEIIATGGLKAAERMKETTNIGAFDTLLQVHGIGPVKARELLAKGIRSIADLRASFKADKDLLNDTQQIGLRYYEAGIQRIPRAEMMAHESMLIGSLPASLTGTIVGSYRRGAANSGDVDMLVGYKGDSKAAQKAFQTFVGDLVKKGYVVEKLVSGVKKWMGYIQLGPDSVPRRLDLLLTPPDEFAYALLYFTGSDRFNVAFRHHCQEKGYTLNEHIMKPTEKGYTLNEHIMKPTEKGLEKGVSAVPVMTDEKDIFDFVGLKFVPPTERLNSDQIVPK